jgi:hypothetical protein
MFQLIEKEESDWLHVPKETYFISNESRGIIYSGFVSGILMLFISTSGPQIEPCNKDPQNLVFNWVTGSIRAG